MKRIILSIVASAVFVFATPFISQASPLAYSVERISGVDRVETAIKISQEGWTKAKVVILSEYADYPDSIASTPFAAHLDAPILLTRGDTLDSRVVKELKRLKPEKVILLGGTGRLSSSIEEALEKQLTLKWERIGGNNRYETSILLAKYVKSDTLILANGDNFPDALSAASFAGIQQFPIILTSKTFPSSVIEYIKETKPSKIIIIGGESVIPTSELSKHNLKIHARLGGANRYETNAKVVSYIGKIYETDDLFLASGLTFPDAVAGTALASKYKAPLLLTEKNDIPPTIYTIMREHMKVEPSKKSSPNNPESPSSNTFHKKGTIIASGGLNLRSTPSATGNVLGTIPKGTTLEILDENDGWLKGSYGGKTGWVVKDYVQLLVQKGTITASAGLNLRETPTPSSGVIMTIPRNTLIELLEKEDSWYKATIDAKTGWVSADYVSLVQETTSDTDKSESVDLTLNGSVYILGGDGVINSNTQNIIEGKKSSNYKENQREFPALPSDLKEPETPSRGGEPEEEEENTPPPAENEEPEEDSEEPVTEPDEEEEPVDEIEYDPSQEILVDPFEEIPYDALEGKRIIIDPGHGGPDTGAIGSNKTYEKQNNLAIALELEEILQEAGATIILTRSQDVSPAANYTELADLQARVNFANEQGADLFISIHNDSFSKPEANGTSTYYSSLNSNQLESLHLANCIQTAVSDTADTYNRGVKQAGFYVIKNTKMPAVLLETAFISNPIEEQRLENPTFRKNIAAAVFEGIYNYFNTPLPKA